MSIISNLSMIGNYFVLLIVIFEFLSRKQRRCRIVVEMVKLMVVYAYCVYPISGCS